MLGWLIMRMICSSRFLNRLSCSTFLMATCWLGGRQEARGGDSG